MPGVLASPDGDDCGHKSHDQTADQKRAGKDGRWPDESEDDESPHASC